MIKLTNYEKNPHKIRTLWEAIKELIGLELELLKRIEDLERKLKTVRSQL
jgi:hypothetical protein